MADERPQRKDMMLTTRATKEEVKAARARAKAEGRSLGDVLRAFLARFGSGEFPSPPPLPGEGRRAKKAPRKNHSE